MSEPVRVLVVDDSALMRKLIPQILERDGSIQVVGTAMDGAFGLKKIEDLRPQVVTLDLEMPRMDGFTMLRILMVSSPVPVIVISSRSGDEKVFKALELGAVDFIAKPTGIISDELLNIQQDLHEKVQAVFKLNLAQVHKRTEGPKPPEFPLPSRKTPPGFVDLVAIGASTGGPPALQTIFSAFKDAPPFALAVSQHMPAGFTKTFAERLNRITGFEVWEARTGDEVVPGRALLAPGGKNLTFHRQDGKIFAQVVDPNPKERYVPCVDAMFASCAQIWGARMLAVVLTGMGNDGSLGVRQVKTAGAQVLAESEESSVVFGMPREAIATGVVDKICPIDQMAREIVYRCGLLPRF